MREEKTNQMDQDSESGNFCEKIVVRVSEQVMDDWLHHQRPDALLVYILCIHFLCRSVGDSGGM